MPKKSSNEAFSTSNENLGNDLRETINRLRKSVGSPPLPPLPPLPPRETLGEETFSVGNKKIQAGISLRLHYLKESKESAEWKPKAKSENESQSVKELNSPVQSNQMNSNVSPEESQNTNLPSVNQITPTSGRLQNEVSNERPNHPHSPVDNASENKQQDQRVTKSTPNQCYDPSSSLLNQSHQKYPTKPVRTEKIGIGSYSKMSFYKQVQVMAREAQSNTPTVMQPRS